MATWQSETTNMTLDLAWLSMHEMCEQQQRDGEGKRIPR